MSHVEVLGQHIIILNTYDAAYDLFEKRSLIYSGRRESLMANEIMGWGYLTVNLQYGEKLQKHRALMHKYLQPGVVNRYESQETKAVYRLLNNLLKTPEKFLRHIRSAAVSTILMVTYGNEVKSDDDMFVTISDEGMKWLVKALTPGAYFVDYVSWLRYIPDCIPGISWKADGRIGRDLSYKMLYELYGITKGKIAEGTNHPCIMNDIWDEKGLMDDSVVNSTSSLDEQYVAEVLAMIYAGGADTNVSVLQSAILAVVLDEEILKKAQKEIDRVVGNDRLPSLNDKRNLPYIEGIIREAFRWNPVLPLGGPHRCDQEDIYDGYRIPAKSVIIPNAWAMLHDPILYPEPLKFRPERWLDSEGQLLDDAVSPMHPNKVIFGFGRRICPGRYLAEDLLFMVLSNVFSVFEIEKAKDELGQPITPAATYSSKLLNDPDPYVCFIKPRSQAAESLIREVYESIV